MCTQQCNRHLDRDQGLCQPLSGLSRLLGRGEVGMDSQVHITFLIPKMVLRHRETFISVKTYSSLASFQSSGQVSEPWVSPYCPGSS